MDRLQSMRVFSMVVEQGGFARAANAMDLSNAVVTRHVADLENHLGTRLLNRTTRKLSLTETGQVYLERVRQILQEIDDADALASCMSRNPSGTLRVYSQLGFGKLQLAEMLPGYATNFPEVTLDVTLSDRTVDLVEDGFDIGFFIGVQKFDASMIARQLGVAEVLLCASPAYIKQHGAPQVPQDLAQHNCLNFNNVDQLRNSWPISGPNGTINIPITSRMMSNNGDLLRHCAASGMGLVAGPSFAMTADLESKQLVRLLPDHRLGQLSVVMVYPSRRLLSAKVRSFVDFISQHYPHPEIDPWLIAAS
ncbi:MAG TPA: LysR family transcriptional regulator [Oxalobacteraceae bacterium]|jgi:DNA-binding transcriptional LysR family regulator|nr:LysR family transcriptional regulator [Oxalobacteraceae bacterium]HCN89616.1 LysR family transcriptional regulator [Oxalobacteraceae bacterium]